MKNIVINGQFFLQTQTGQQRYAREILSEMDKLITKDEVVIVVPVRTVEIPNYKNFKIIRHGNINNRLWEQIDLMSYLLKTKQISFNFCNTAPFIRPGITVIHDIAPITHKEFFNTWQGKIARLYYSNNQSRMIKSGFPIITVSEFSKNDILQQFKIESEKITVIPNAWQHFEKITLDESVFCKYRNIIKGEYYFSLGSSLKQKNYMWVYNNAIYNHAMSYVIAGKSIKNYKYIDSIPSNVQHLGYLTDGKIKALMQNCKAFLFPSLFEGFGIPPLEALSVGVPIIVSNTASLPEIFEDSATYIDPLNPNVDIGTIIKNITDLKRKQILSKYSWKDSAIMLYELLKRYDAEFL
jgi:glycosyltransferase involved in cell wall biosynthesis